MSGKLNEPGTLVIEWINGQPAELAEYTVAAGPWVYADWLCWRASAESSVTTYAPLANIATWTKEVTQ